MRNVSKLMLLVFAFPAVDVIGMAQAQQIASGSDEVHRYEMSVRQPAVKNDGMTWWRLAMHYQDSARYADAEHAYLRALEFLRSSDQTTQANLMDQLGTLYVQMGRYPEAAEMEQKALALREAQKDSLGVGLSWMHLAMLSLGTHQNVNGEAYAELAVERLVPDRSTRTEPNSATPEQKMTALIYLSLARCAAHNCAGAFSPLKKAMTIAEANYPKQSFPVAYISFLEGYSQWKRGDTRSAATLMKSGTEGMDAQLGWGHPTYLSAMQQYETFLTQSGHESEAAEVKRKIARLSGSQPALQSANAEQVPALP